ncbi:MAG: YraN family protein [Akkermansiaceae bacterium]
MNLDEPRELMKKGTWKLSHGVARVRSSVARFSSLLNSPTRLEVRGRRMGHMEVGNLGEQIAAHFLMRKGWKLLYRNFRAPTGGEVDLVMRGGHDFNQLVFVEVKTRTRRGFGRPLEAVDKDKQALIERGANEWLRLLAEQNRGDDEDFRRTISWRYDVVEIILQQGEKPDVNLVESAF